MISRRTFQRILGGVLAAHAMGVRSQPAGRAYRVALLRPTPAPPTLDSVSAEVVLAKAFARMGYAEGRNFHLEHRYGDGDPQRLQAHARELVQERVDVIVAVTPSGVRAAMAATTSIPIVFFVNQDPIAAGFVQSLARPGSNVTGVLIAPEGTLGAKKLDLLKAAIPSARRVTVIESGDPAISRVQMPELEQAASKLGMDVPLVTLRNGDYGDAFKRVVATKPDAVFVMADSYFMINRGPIIAQTLKHRLASMWEWREQVQDGGLMSYASDLADLYRKGARYVARIFNGENPGELPIEQPSKYELAINMITAKRMGLEIPTSVLARADEVIG